MFSILLALFISSSPELQADPSASDDLLEVMEELESQLNQTVVSSTKHEQRAAKAPAVVTVVNSDEISARGYTSLADVLRTIPGFYDVYDLSFHNVGVRGVNGGARASGNVIKVMINGQAVSFRPTTGNFFGEELVPMAAVERVEIIRGPASALYGANAFLGVINIITKTGSQVNGANLVGRGGAIRQYPAVGGGALMGGGAGSSEVMIAADASVMNRSGLTLAPSSPVEARSGTDIASRGASVGDMSRPKSVVGQASIGTPTDHGKLSLLASIQAPDMGGEFQDYAPLTHGTRLVMMNQTYRLSYDLAVGDKVSLRAFGTWFDSSPSSAERLDLNLDARVLKRNFGANGFELGLEGQYNPLQNLSLTLGTDYVSENQRLLTYDQLVLQDIFAADGSILRATGTVIPDAGAGRTKEFLNVGAYAQGMWDATSSLSFTVGARLDRHNIYGVQFNPRVGVVYAPERRPYYLKALFGTSFKAPSAEQLYTRPMQASDIRGNAQLAAQRARTAEVAGGWQFGNRAELSADLFVTQIQGRVEFVQSGLYQTAENLRDELYAGGELEGRLRVSPAAQGRLGVGIAKNIGSNNLGPALSGVQVSQPLYPVLQTHLIADFTIPRVDVRVSPEISYVGPRSASQFNAVKSGRAYDLPPYVLTSLSVSSGARHFFGNRETRLTLRATNLLNTQYGDPGFNGIDVPALGRSVFLSWNQQL